MEATSLKILLVEDNLADARLIKEMLSESKTIRVELAHKKQLGDALKCLEEMSFDLVLLDIHLPDSQGLDTVMRVVSSAPELPIIVLTGLDDDAMGIQSVDQGAQDYLVKGQLNKRLLARAIIYAFERKQIQEKLNSAHHDLEQKVTERTRELTSLNEQLMQEVEERRNAEEKVRLNESRLEALLKMSEMRKATVEELSDFVLEKGVQLTQSKFGFIGFMNDEETVMTLHAWSQSVMEQCGIIDKPIHYPIEEAGLWGDAIRQRKPLVVNDYSAPNPHKKGYPAEHIQLLRIMVVPIMHEKRVVALMAVGNKEKEYDELDLRQLKLLMDGMWEIIEHNRSEENSRQLREKLSHLTRVATIGELTTSLAHELNQPLTTIMSNAQAVQRLLKSDVPDMREVKDALTDIINDNRRASEVIRSLRKLLKQGDLLRSPLDINKLIQETLTLVHSDIIANNISLTLKLATQLPIILGDHIQLQQVILNLVLNGVEAMKDATPDLRELVLMTHNDDSSAVTVVVQDSGDGIDVGKLEKVFDPFFTTKPDGLGMGLSINRTIIESHGGRIWATQNPDGGAVFSFNLPVYKKQLS